MRISTRWFFKLSVSVMVVVLIDSDGVFLSSKMSWFKLKHLFFKKLVINISRFFEILDPSVFEWKAVILSWILEFWSKKTSKSIKYACSSLFSAKVALFFLKNKFSGWKCLSGFSKLWNGRTVEDVATAIGDWLFDWLSNQIVPPIIQPMVAMPKKGGSIFLVSTLTFKVVCFLTGTKLG